MQNQRYYSNKQQYTVDLDNRTLRTAEAKNVEYESSKYNIILHHNIHNTFFYYSCECSEL